jgi:hypothetical protein
MHVFDKSSGLAVRHPWQSRHFCFWFVRRDDDVIYVCNDKLFEALRLAARCNILGWILKYFLASKTFAQKEDFGNWTRLKQGLHKKTCTIAMCRMAHNAVDC